MPTTSNISGTAALVGHPARGSMMIALMDGRALTAGELARVAGVLPQTASSHLAQLVEAGLLQVHRQGRHRYHRLASPAVARMLESIIEVADGAATASGRSVVTGPRDRAMRAARTCYDHLAGRLGVALADSLVARGHLELSPEGGALTETGLAFLQDFGVSLEPPGRGRVFCRPCLDWSERRLHVGGSLGAALAARCFVLGWVERVPRSRAVAVTSGGRAGFAERFGIGP